MSLSFFGSLRACGGGGGVVAIDTRSGQPLAQVKEWLAERAKCVLNLWCSWLSYTRTISGRCVPY